MSSMASQITSLMIVYLKVYSGAYQRKHQSFAWLAFVWGNHRWPVNSPHKKPVTRKMLPFDDVIMNKVAIDMLYHTHISWHHWNVSLNTTVWTKGMPFLYNVSTFILIYSRKIIVLLKFRWQLFQRRYSQYVNMGSNNGWCLQATSHCPLSESTLVKIPEPVMSDLHTEISHEVWTAKCNKTIRWRPTCY